MTMKKEQSAMAVVFLGNQILATKELIYGKVRLSLPKGHIEQGETTIDCAIRECFEETNCQLTKNQCIQSLEPFRVNFLNSENEEVEKSIYPIVFQIDAMPHLQIKEERVLDISFMSIESFLENASYENVIQIVKQAMKYIK